MAGRDKTRVALFALTLATLFYFYPGGDPNQTSRWLLTDAIVTRGRPDITETHGGSVDKGELRGRYYSDKAPGISLLAVPLTAAMRGLERATGLDPESRPVLRARVHFLSFLLSGVPAALTGWLLADLAALLGARRRRADLLGCAYALATLAFPYGTVLYGHTLSALLVFAAFFRVARAELDSEAAGDVSIALGARGATVLGALVAGAFVVEYPTFILGATIALYTLYRTAAAARLAVLGRIALGAAGPGLVQAAFSTWAFGSPFALPYKYVVEPLFRAHTASGLFGIGLPIPAAVYGALVSPYRGIFFFCPVLVLAFAGYAAWLRDGRALRVAGLAAALSLAGLLFAVSYYAWDGGLATGSRHLVPIAAFAILPLAFFVESGRAARAITFALSVVSALILGATLSVTMHHAEGDPFGPSGLYTVVVPSLLRGDLGIFFGDVVGTLPRGDLAGTVASVLGAPPWLALALPASAWAVMLAWASRAPSPEGDRAR